MEDLVVAISSGLADPTHRVVALLVAIDGLGGAGKSTFANDLARRLRACQISAEIVHMDDFYLPSTQRPQVEQQENQIGSAFDWQRLRDQVLTPLSLGQRVVYQRYDWSADELADWIPLTATAVVIVEGVYTLRHELRSYYDFSVWVDCPRAVRLARGIARDGKEARRQWEEEWMPQEDRYLASQLPHFAAGWVYAGNGPSDQNGMWKRLRPQR